ncbi:MULTISPECIES: fatty acyl-CoA synthetase [unclassified Pseudofrankia]|uniref:fatty acyl-CoA synthetase n=1 Tax=unclassified Pseudofrankia TaxID=2994372 RepID=UPI0008DB182E|nr:MULTISPECIES: fatty acyl-CoA synthetase [unclassified Pseudofrankia]MDT3446323.1 fatty acyl-CoA synthetase [Pseudofrankia sp. BMG5.37]OHV57232.1 acyl-CoA synthetase [Pseudofrankia sp. BMG5.36]
MQPHDHLVTTARHQGIADLLHRTAARRPDHRALVWGDRVDTFAELDQIVTRVANTIHERGVGKGDRVMMFAHNSRDFVVFYFALARLGAISVPANFMLNVDELGYIINHANPVGYLVEESLAHTMQSAWKSAKGDQPPRLRGWISSGASGAPPDGWDDVVSLAAPGDDRAPDVDVADDDPIQLMYTSGTESRPKGVTLTSRSLIAQYVSCIVDGDMTADDVEVHSLPFYHCAQLHCFLTPDVYVGATSVILPRPDPEMICAAIERERATKFFGPPTVWISIMRSEAFERHDLSSLRKGYYGASIMPVEVLREIGDRLPDVDLWNFYGQTEMAPVATILKPRDQVARAGSAGVATLNVETRVVDLDDREVSPGVVGEIVHRSPQAMLGYWNDPEKTAAAFRNGWFHSGDLGVTDADGFLTVVDRKKDMIKTGGENVASKEVEECLFQHPAVAEVAVFGVPDPQWIEAVAACVVLRDGEASKPDDLISFARVRLAGYKTPKHVFIVDQLPKNPSGKILKRELRNTYSHVPTAGGR